jgi:hypothetical protein
MNENSLKVWLSLIPIATGILYVMGSMFLQGYLSAFNLDSTQFPVPNDRTLLNGYTLLITGGLVAWLLFFAAVFLTLISVVVGRVVMASNPKFLQRIKERKAKSANQTAALMQGVGGQSAEDTIYRVCIWALVIGFGVMMLFFVTVLSRQYGVAQAKEDIENFKVGKGNYVSVLADTLKGPTKAIQLLCGTTHCAFWIGDRTVVLKQDQIKSLEAFIPNALKTVQTKSEIR